MLHIYSINNKILYFSITFTVFLFLTFIPGKVVLAKTPTSVAIVNLQTLLQDSIAAKDIQKQLSKERDKLQKEFSDIGEELKSIEKDLADKRDELSAEEFEKRRKSFEEKFLDTRRTVQGRKNALDEALNESIRKLRIQILEIVAEIADKQEYDLILNRQNVVIVDKKNDITSQVMDELNKRLKSVKLEVKNKK